MLVICYDLHWQFDAIYGYYFGYKVQNSTYPLRGLGTNYEVKSWFLQGFLILNNFRLYVDSLAIAIFKEFNLDTTFPFCVEIPIWR